MSDKISVTLLTKKEAAKFVRLYGSHVQVNRNRYTLNWCKEILQNGQSMAGLCDAMNQQIFIDPTHEVEATLLHEIAHAEIAEGGFKQRTDWDMNLEEQIVEALSQSIAHNFKVRRR